MNNTASNLSGLVPYMIGFIAVAAAGAVVSFAIIAHAAATFRPRTGPHPHRAARQRLRPGSVHLRDRLRWQ